MLNEIYVWKPRIKDSVFLTHLYEHLLNKHLNEEIKNEGLDNQGIIVNGETFIDGTFTELFFLDNSISDALLRIVNAFPEDIPKSDFLLNIQGELERLESELSEVDNTDEEFALYKGLEVEGYYLHDLVKMGKYSSVDEIYTELIETGKSSVYQITDNKVETIEHVDFQSSMYSKNICISGDYKGFEYFDLSIPASSIREYALFRLLSFVLGMVDESIINKKILSPQNIYLGYTFPLVTERKLNILGLVSGNELKQSSFEIISNMDSLELTEIEFTRFKNSFLTYLYVYVPVKDLFSDLIKAELVGNNDVRFDMIVNEVQMVKIDELNRFFKKIVQEN